ncbi:MAG: DUF2384 domain-containing protein [Fuerstiella sp.]
MVTTKGKSKSRRAVVARIPGTRLLGLKVRRKEELVRMVQAGLDVDHLVSLIKQSGLTKERIARLVAIPPRTLARRQREGWLSPEESDRLLRASRVVEAAVDLFEGDVDEARHWLLTPTPALSGDSPLEFTSTDVGAREVESLIGRLEHGVFA